MGIAMRMSMGGQPSIYDQQATLGEKFLVGFFLPVVFSSVWYFFGWIKSVFNP